MKKLLTFLPALLLTISLVVGCGSTGLPVSEGGSNGNSGTTVSSEENTETDDKDTDGSQNGDAQTGDSQENAEDPETSDSNSASQDAAVSEFGTYTSRDEVALYLHLYGHLPDNFITKKAAKKLGWVSSEGNLGKVAPGKSIGGDHFGNYEGILPSGHNYYECDIDSDGSYRGAKRIIYSDDGLIYYTDDHYKSFTLLYGEE